ncbi:sugar porter family MFS transporter [Shewanella acanthi]|uniref:sugar porter family MFS transporter n=1 Tax=Shewanella acanthi TaxID=2864212 RepID=UPI001C65690C|nr:sugar porter family MFS transporter [Shewanella acanthi]QYJ78341.1 sugar porter family MFS transporter [Shewanella acanthi]
MNHNLNSSYIWMICLTAACGGFLFGYDWVVIGGAKPFYELYFNVNDPNVSGWLMGSALIGCIFGAAFSGVISDRWGRKPALVISALLFIVSAAGNAWANNIDLFVIARIIGGIGIGVASTVSPMYISEISPPEKRGKLVSINQLTIVIGVLFAQLVNLFIAEPTPANLSTNEMLALWNVQTGWRYMFAAELIPAVVFLLLVTIIPESPRWLIQKSRTAEASEVLGKIGRGDYATVVMADIQKNISESHNKGAIKDLMSLKPILVIGVVLAAFQQWSGINVVFNYAQEIFSSAGFDIDDTLKSIVATGSVNLIFTLIALPLVDKLGRRKLMLLGSISLAIIYLMIALAYSAGTLGLPILILVLLAIATYAMTLAPVTWVLIAELFPNHIRGLGMAACTFSLWFASFGLTYTFPFINRAFDAEGSFLIYALICFSGFIFVWKKVPETSQLTLEEIENQLQRQTVKGNSPDCPVKI